ncbi:hypothetical protein ACLOJK_033134 [Asimina triloba]
MIAETTMTVSAPRGKPNFPALSADHHLSNLRFQRQSTFMPILSWSIKCCHVPQPQAPRYAEMLNVTISNLRYAKANAPKPFALIFPINADQVSTSIGCSRGASLAIRVRSGGHSYEGLAGTAEQPFVIIDMSSLDRVTVDLDTETAWAEKLYFAIGRASNKHAASAGFWPPVGVGGHFQCRVLDRKAMGEDVFWAIRGGGGGSWGVVVASKSQLLRVPEKVTAFQFVRVGTVTQVAEIWYKWQKVAPELEDEFYIGFRASPGKDAVLYHLEFAGLYLGLKASGLNIIGRRFPELKVTSDECQEMSWVESAAYLAGASRVEDLKNRTYFPRSYFKAKHDHGNV